MMASKIKASNMAYHIQKLVDSPETWEAVKRKDEKSFRGICEKLKVPEKYIDSLKSIAFSKEVGPNQWPWE